MHQTSFDCNIQSSAKNFNFDHLLQPFVFNTKPQDKIKNVKIVGLRLKPHNNVCDITFNVPSNYSKTIYDLVNCWFDFNDPFVRIFIIKEVKILIEFFEESQNPAHLVKVKDCGRYLLQRHSKQKESIIIKNLKSWNLIK